MLLSLAWPWNRSSFSGLSDVRVSQAFLICNLIASTGLQACPHSARGLPPCRVLLPQPSCLVNLSTGQPAWRLWGAFVRALSKLCCTEQGDVG